MGHEVLSNLGAFALQSCAVAGAAALLVRLLRVSAPGPRYACWRLILIVCLLTPWLLRQPAAPVAAAEPVAVATSATALVELPPGQALSAPAVPTQPTPAPFPWDRAVAAVIVAGAIARAGWLMFGWMRLCRLRNRGIPLDDSDYGEIQSTLGTRATLRAVDGLTQPATFGLLRPVVLLPPSVTGAPPALRRAVVTHELFHVQRRDWVWVLAEEAVRTALWFHPAILWLTSRIQLAREELVDELTVLATGNRRAYIEALFAFADAEPVQPAPAFARRRHLFTRIVGLSKETVMSSPRVVLSMATVMATLLICSWYASRAFPVMAAAPTSVAAADEVLATSGPAIRDAVPPAAAAAQGARGAGAARPGPPPRPANPQVVASGNPVTPENPIPRRIYSVPVAYPQELQGSGFSAAVEVRVLVDGNGVPSVMPNRIAVATSQPDPTWLAMNVNPGGGRPGDFDQARELLNAVMQARQKQTAAFREAVLQSIGQWRYDAPVQAPLEFSIAVTFAAGQDGVVTQSAEARGVSALGNRVSVGSLGVAGNPVDPAGRIPNAELAEIDRQQIELAKKRGDLVVRYSPQHPDVVKLDSQLRDLALARERLVADLQKASAAAVATQSPDGAVRPVRVGGNVKPPAKTKHVNPVYPPDALAERVQGVVIIEATIDETGHVSEARILRSIPLLDEAALDAVRQWEFAPTLLNGSAVPIVMTVTVQFSLN